MKIYPHGTDIVLPLGRGSKFDNFELRMALRSIERYAVDAGNVYIVSDSAPLWLKNVHVISVEDRHLHNKDANIIDKLMAAAKLPELSEKFVFWSDDQFAMQPLMLHLLPAVFNRRGAADFNSDKIWHRRMRRTFEYLARQGIKLEHNFDCHLPQLMDKKLFCKIMQSVDYTAQPGYCVNTLYFGLAEIPGLVAQENIKTTIEKCVFLPAMPGGSLFIGCNDDAMLGNLPELLTGYFPDKSCYEK